VHHPDRGDPAATRQSRRRRALLELFIEHGIRPARHSKPVGEDHDRRGGRVHVDRVGAWFTFLHWNTIGIAVGTHERTNSDPNAGTTTITRSAHRSACDIARGITLREQEVVEDVRRRSLDFVALVDSHR
jgi:hypothetical protein